MTLGLKGKGVHDLAQSGARDSDQENVGSFPEDIEICDEGESLEWLTRVSSSRLPPGHPCLEYLKTCGVDLGASEDINKFTANSSPLGGKRWYVDVTVKGTVGEFLIDTGASHSLISKEFFDRMSGRINNLRERVSACTADGSGMRTFGKAYMNVKISGKEYVMSPMVADIQDEGII